MQKFLIVCFYSILVFSAIALFQKRKKVLGFGLNFQSSSKEINCSSVPQTNKKDIQLNFSLRSSLDLGYLYNIGIGTKWILK